MNGEDLKPRTKKMDRLHVNMIRIVDQGGAELKDWVRSCDMETTIGLLDHLQALIHCEEGIDQRTGMLALVTLSTMLGELYEEHPPAPPTDSG